MVPEHLELTGLPIYAVDEVAKHDHETDHGTEQGFYAFVTILSLTFVSNAYVRPAVLQPIAVNPVSTLTAATRELFGNPDPYVGNGFQPVPDPGDDRLGVGVVACGVYERRGYVDSA